jgi:MerR family transcriptional regulator/heat shock protein HspR
MDQSFIEPVMSIGVASEKLGISPETLRVYEREGLIIPFKTKTNRRLYSHQDLEWIKCFRNQMKTNGLNFAGVRVLLALIPCWNIKGCSTDEQSNCPAYMNGESVCWTTNERGCKMCAQDICRDCSVYLTACAAGKLNTMYLTSDK